MRRQIAPKTDPVIPFTQTMASDTYYKDMWLRRNKSALQVVIVLMSLVFLVMVVQLFYRRAPAEDRVVMNEPGLPGSHGGGDSIPGAGHIRGRVFKDDDDDSDPGVELDDVAADRDSDCCTVFDLWQRPNYYFECVPMVELPMDDPPLICPLEQQGSNSSFNADTARLILKQLESGGESFGLIDVGATLGAYSLAAASMGNAVVAIEPDINLVKHFHKAAKLGRLESRVTLLNNVIGGDRSYVSIVEGEPEVKTVLLDDLPAFCKFRKAVMKMALGGQEHRAIEHAKFLFTELQITYIFFEWANIKRLTNEADTDMVRAMILYFNKRGYVPRTYMGKVLSIQKWPHWPDDIYWQKM